jgi:hypothetical protein
VGSEHHALGLGRGRSGARDVKRAAGDRYLEADGKGIVAW